MAICKRFAELSGQGYPVLEFDGQNQTRAIVRWPKIDFFLFYMILVKYKNNFLLSKKVGMDYNFKRREYIGIFLSVLS